ncbi:MAG: hypothetical protein ACYTFM_12500, partial [Planctomycetota bacterium]|jgi:phosphoglycerate-specific signal transduction histidine kinase
LEPHHLKSNDTREINLFDYLTWDRKEIKNTIMNELNWQKPTDRLSTWKVDCKIHPLDNYFFYLLFGCTRDCLGYTTMINEDQIEREEALQQEEEAIRRIEDNVINVLRDEIGLTPKQTNKVLDVAGSKLSAV